MTLLTPPGHLQAGTYTAKLDRMFLHTAETFPDLSATLSARQGFYSGRVPTYANAGGMNVNVSPCAGVIQNTFASAAGDYKFVNDGTIGFTSAASSPTLNRNDIYGFQVKDNFYDASGLNSIIPVVLQGANAAGTPADPALPASFIPVARGVINATVTSPTLQSMLRTTVNDGGILTIASATERNAISTPWIGLTILRTDRLWEEWYTGAGWHVDGVAMCASVADRDGSTGITHPYNGQLAVTLDTGTVWQRKSGAWVGLFGSGGTYPNSVQNTAGTSSAGAFSATLTGGTTCSMTFVAPATGTVDIHNTAQVSNNTGGMSSIASVEVRAGAVVGSGTVVLAAAIENGILAGDATRCTVITPVTGLTAGSTYNVQVLYVVTGGTGTFANKRLTVRPAA